MKIIQVISAARIESFDGRPSEAITPVLWSQVMAPLRENQRRIIEAASLIEHELDTIISHYFFGRSDDNNSEGKTRFQSLVLSSDWCTFSVKRRLVIHIVNETNALTGKAKDDLNSALRRVMSHRNAFVHGVFTSDGRKVKLSFFEGDPRFKFLDDDYLEKVEQDIDKCFMGVHQVAYKVGALKLSELSGPPDPDNPMDPRTWDDDR